MNNGKVGAVMVVGGGIGGIQAALDLADSGFKVYMVEKGPSIGGVMAQLDKTFPTNDCAMCILAPKLVSVARHPNIKIITNAEIDKLSGDPGNFVVTVQKKPRFVDEDKCTGCGLCMANCPVRQIAYGDTRSEEVALSPDDFNRISGIIKEYAGRKGTLMPILQKINGAYNYLPADLLKFISQELRIPMSLVYNVATFYRTFSLKKRGQHIIRVCQGTACHVRGAKRVLEEFIKILGVAPGETTADFKFTLEIVNCVGACALAPVSIIDAEYFGQMSSRRVAGAVDKYHKRN
jgi:NADH:ubiquinone oxidoreductase subunit E/NAD-dependent dihydropyrimidine dehydrogenase PreA subunit